MSSITFNYQSNITPIEFGFMKDHQLFILYNDDNRPESGVFLVDLSGVDYFAAPFEFSEESVIC